MIKLILITINSCCNSNKLFQKNTAQRFLKQENIECWREDQIEKIVLK